VCQSAHLIEEEKLLSVAHGEASPERRAATLQRRQQEVARGHLVAVQGRSEWMPGLTCTPRQHPRLGKERCSWVVGRTTLVRDAAAHGGVSWPVRPVVQRLSTLSRRVEGVPTGWAVASVLAIVELISCKHRASSRPRRAYIHQRQPTTNADTLSDQAL